jgi:hypothetical protein
MDQMMSSTKLPRDFPKAHQLPKTLFCMVGFLADETLRIVFSLSLSLLFLSSLPPSRRTGPPPPPCPSISSSAHGPRPTLDSSFSLAGSPPRSRRGGAARRSWSLPCRSRPRSNGEGRRGSGTSAPPPPSLPHQSRPRRRPTAVTLVRPCRGAPPLLEPLARRRAAPLLLPSESR